ncbi:MAG: helix-turn-helix transcriptional regulator [Clostridiales bacterium]|nr:helix-turn-helix transcriptional regulator [Clostridiales bacterium]
MYDSFIIALKIKEVAKSRNVTLKYMLEQLELGSNTISNMRHGMMVSAGTLACIADYLDCSVDYLLGRTDNIDVNR